MGYVSFREGKSSKRQATVSLTTWRFQESSWSPPNKKESMTETSVHSIRAVDGISREMYHTWMLWGTYTIHGTGWYIYLRGWLIFQ